MLLMLLHTLGVSKYVVNEDYDKLVQLFHKHLIHEVHKIRGCVGESKGHHCELILPVTGDKDGLGDVAFPNLEFGGILTLNPPSKNTWLLSAGRINHLFWVGDTCFR
jgi:hypothetical protein